MENSEASTMVKTECEMVVYDEIIANLATSDTNGPEFYPFCPIKQELNAPKVLTYEEMKDPKLRHIINDHNYISSEDGYTRNVRQNLIDFVQAKSESANMDVSETQIEILVDTILGLLSKVTDLDSAIDKFKTVGVLEENKLSIKLDSDALKIVNFMEKPPTLDDIAQRLESDLDFDLNLLIKTEVENQVNANVDQILEYKEKALEADDNFSESKDKSMNSEDKSMNSEDKSMNSEDKSMDSEDKSMDSEDKSIGSEDKSMDSEDKSMDSEDKSMDFEDKSMDSENKSFDTENKPLNSESKSLDSVDKPDSNVKLSELQEEASEFQTIPALGPEDKQSGEEMFNETAEQLSELNEQLDMILGKEEETIPIKIESNSIHDKTSDIVISKVEYTYDPNFGAQPTELNKMPDESGNVATTIAMDISETKSSQLDETTAQEPTSDIATGEAHTETASTQELHNHSDNKISDHDSEKQETVEKPSTENEPKVTEEIPSEDVDTVPPKVPIVIEQLLKFVEQLKTDCVEVSAKPDFDLENFLALKLKEHKSIVNSIILKDSSIQTEKVISKKKLRKINAQDKRHLLESSNDSDSSNCSSMDKTLNELEAEYKSRKPFLSKHASSKESLVSKKSYKDSKYFAPDFESDGVVSQFGGSISSLSKHESFDLDQSTDSEPKKKEKKKSTRALSQESSSSLEKPNSKEDDKVEEKSTNESDKENRISSIGSPGSCESKKSKADESVDDDVQDKEIERLLNLKSLADPQKNIPTVNHSKQKSSSKLSSKTDSLYEVMQEIDGISMSDDSMGEDSEQILTEKQFLVKCNENLKKQLLESASSDSENSNENDDIDLIKKINEDSSDEDNQRESYVDKFLETLVDDEGSNPGDKEESKTDSPIKKETANPSIEANTTIDEISPTANSITSFRETFNSKQKENAQKCFENILAKETRQRELKQQEDLIELSAESSTSDVEECSTETKDKTLRIKPMLRHDQLESETIYAQKKEADRLRRLEKRNNFLAKILKSKNDEVTDKDLVLDYTSVNKKFIKVHADIVKHLKPHQRDGVKFMYDSTYGCVDSVKESSGSGCILAHCMGLGKTLQIIALLHTVTSYKELKTNKIMVLCPKSTIMNWADEIQRWLGPLDVKNLQIFNFSDTADIYEKINVLRQWSLSSKKAGCLIMGYEAFRSLVFYNTSKTRARSNMRVEDIRGNINKYLLKPGADLVVCDEGHIIKNRKSGISLAAAEIITPKRIILTGTPIQNNLKEYYAMVNFIKPLILGTEKEFANLYANPIKNGQHKDSSKRDIKVMKQRSFVLHKKLSKFVQRKEAELLQSFLPQKFEYVLFIPMTDVQNTLYEYVLEAISKREDSRGKSLLTDYTCLRKIWTHPKVLEDAWKNAITAKNKKDPPKRQTSHIAHSDDDQPDDIYDNQTGVISVQHDWWRELVTESDLELILPSNKLKTMFEIIRMAEENAFVAVLNVVEYFFHKINAKQREFYMHNEDKPTGHWINGQDYYRLDGKTNKTLRHEMVKRFNDPKNKRTRVFLISAKAGGQGINLIGANRVIILDTSWNPANDQQNIFRIFRLGQKRNCYVYRLIAMGTMEEKVYSRSVTKQAMSFRVVDEQQIDRHYNMAELAELYTLTKPCYNERPVPVFPQDQTLANLLLNFPDLVYKYHEHDSLLENKVEQELSEQDKADAWVAYERDLQINSEPRDAMEGGFHGYPLFNQGNYMYPPLSDFDPKNYLPGSCDLNQIDIASRNALGSSLLPNYLASRNSYLDILNMYKNLSSTLLNDKGGRPPHYNPAYGMSLTSGMMNNTGMLPPNESHLSALANPYYPFPNSSLNPNAMLSNASLSGPSQVSADRYDKNMITPDYPPSMRNDKNMITPDYPPSMRNDKNMITPDYPSSMRSSFPAPMPAPFTKDITGRSTQSKSLLQNSPVGASSSLNMRSPSTRQTQQNMFSTNSSRDTIPSNVISKKIGKAISKPIVINSPSGLESAAKNKQLMDPQLRSSSPRQTIVIEDSPAKQATTSSVLPVNMGIVYPKPILLPSSPLSDMNESGSVKKSGSSMQIIPTHSPITDSVRKKFDNISPNISLTAVRSVPPKNSQSEKSPPTISLLETSVTPSRKRRSSFGTSSPGISSAEQPKKVQKY